MFDPCVILKACRYLPGRRPGPVTPAAAVAPVKTVGGTLAFRIKFTGSSTTITEPVTPLEVSASEGSGEAAFQLFALISHWKVPVSVQFGPVGPVQQ